MNVYLKILSFITLLQLLGCSGKTLNVDHHIPGSFGFLPESAGKLWGGSASLDTHSAHKLNLANTSQTSFLSHATDTTVNTTKSFDSTVGVGAKGSFRLLRRLDYILKARIESPVMHGLKFQFLGSPAVEIEEGWKMAFAGMYGEGTDEEDSGSFSMSVENATPENLDNVSAEIEMRQREAALLIGHRINENWLLYFNNHYTRVNSNSTLFVGEDKYYLKAQTQVISHIVGARLTIRGEISPFIQSSVGYSKAKLLPGVEHDFMAAEANLGIQW